MVTTQAALQEWTDGLDLEDIEDAKNFMTNSSLAIAETLENMNIIELTQEALPNIGFVHTG